MATGTSTKPANGNKSNAPATLEDLSEQIETLKNDLAALTSSLGDYGKSKADAAVGSAKATASQFSEASQLRAMEAQEKAEDFIRTQPATAMGIAAGLGFLVGLVTARR